MIFLDRALHPRYWSEAAKKIKASGCWAPEQAKGKGRLNRVLKAVSKGGRQGGLLEEEGGFIKGRRNRITEKSESARLQSGGRWRIWGPNFSPDKTSFVRGRIQIQDCQVEKSRNQAFSH